MILTRTIWRHAVATVIVVLLSGWGSGAGRASPPSCTDKLPDSYYGEECKGGGDILTLIYAVATGQYLDGDGGPPPPFTSNSDQPLDASFGPNPDIVPVVGDLGGPVDTDIDWGPAPAPYTYPSDNAGTLRATSVRHNTSAHEPSLDEPYAQIYVGIVLENYFLAVNGYQLSDESFLFGDLHYEFVGLPGLPASGDGPDAESNNRPDDVVPFVGDLGSMPTDLQDYGRTDNAGTPATPNSSVPETTTNAANTITANYSWKSGTGKPDTASTTGNQPLAGAEYNMSAAITPTLGYTVGPGAWEFAWALSGTPETMTLNTDEPSADIVPVGDLGGDSPEVVPFAGYEIAPPPSSVIPPRMYLNTDASSSTTNASAVPAWVNDAISDFLLGAEPSDELIDWLSPRNDADDDCDDCGDCDDCDWPLEVGAWGQEIRFNYVYVWTYLGLGASEEVLIKHNNRGAPAIDIIPPVPPPQVWIGFRARLPEEVPTTGNSQQVRGYDQRNWSTGLPGQSDAPATIGGSTGSDVKPLTPHEEIKQKLEVENGFSIGQKGFSPTAATPTSSSMQGSLNWSTAPPTGQPGSTPKTSDALFRDALGQPGAGANAGATGNNEMEGHPTKIENGVLNRSEEIQPFSKSGESGSTVKSKLSKAAPSTPPTLSSHNFSAHSFGPLGGSGMMSNRSGGMPMRNAPGGQRHKY